MWTSRLLAPASRQPKRDSHVTCAMCWCHWEAFKSRAASPRMRLLSGSDLWIACPKTYQRRSIRWKHSTTPKSKVRPRPRLRGDGENSLRKTKRVRRTGSFRTLFFLTVLTLAPGVASAQGEPIAQSPHAHAKPSGSGWECDRGYREVDQLCVAIQVPPHAFLNSRGDGWECDRGYREANAACVIVEVPPNARLDFGGRGWECDRGYQKIDQSCVSIEVPAHAYLDHTGDGWKCDRGFQQHGETCAPFEIPLQGHLARSGNDWECNHGFRRTLTSAPPGTTGIAMRVIGCTGELVW